VVDGRRPPCRDQAVGGEIPRSWNEGIPWSNADIVTAFDEEGWSMGVGHLVGIRPLAARFLDLGTANPLGSDNSIDLDGEGVDSAASSRTAAATAGPVGVSVLMAEIRR
jgi:hypothetical protein